MQPKTVSADRSPGDLDQMMIVTEDDYLRARGRSGQHGTNRQAYQERVAVRA